jgi:prophage regulatory protein
MKKILRLNKTMEATGLSRSSIYSFIKQKQFPAQVNIGKRAVGWYSEDISNWLDERIKSQSEKQC